MEELHKLIPDLDIVWVKNPQYEYELPAWMRPVKWRSWRWLYEYATAKIWTNNCCEPDYVVERIIALGCENCVESKENYGKARASVNDYTRFEEIC